MNDTDDKFYFEKYHFLTQKFIRYVGFSVYGLCVFTTIMNICTFLRKKYIRRTCSLYLLIASFCDFLHIHTGLLLYILQYGFQYNRFNISTGQHKIMTYLVYVPMIISATLTILTYVNQFLLSSRIVSRWNFGSFPVAIRNIILTIIFWFIASIPVSLCVNIHYHVFNSERFTCSNTCQTLLCRWIYGLYTCLFNGILIPMIMIIVGLLTYKNIRHLQRRLNFRSTFTQRINEQLIRMLILQSFKSLVTSVPYTIYNIYLIITINRKKSVEHQGMEIFIGEIVHLVFWSNYTSFIIYICSSNIFRQQWIRTMKEVFCCICVRK